jgi:hypothetical protein
LVPKSAPATADPQIGPNRWYATIATTVPTASPAKYPLIIQPFLLMLAVGQIWSISRNMPHVGPFYYTLGSTPNAGRLGMSDVEAKRNVYSFRDDIIGKTIPDNVIC